MEFPYQNFLEKEILRKEIKRALFFHYTDRWYFGDLLRHTSWISSLSKISKRLTVATHKNFLPIFEHDKRIYECVPVGEIREKDFSSYDLVIFPSSFPPTYHSPFVKRGIYSYNSGFQYAVYGKVIRTFSKNELNYFRSSSPDCKRLFLPEGEYYQTQLTNSEKKNGEKILNRLFGKKTKEIIIVNPTGSNFFTRETNIKKEVPNTLEVRDYRHLIRGLLKTFPRHRLLLASSLKPRDKENFEMLKELKMIRSERVRAITSITTAEKGLSFREFASILSNPRIAGIIGNGTGTNTHMAAMFNLPSMSIEREVDNEMKDNWKDPFAFQVGPFRWRNPNIFVSAYSLNWRTRSEGDFLKMSQVFESHLRIVGNKFNKIFSGKEKMEELSEKIIASLDKNDFAEAFPHIKKMARDIRYPHIRRYLFNFRNELEYVNSVKRGIGGFYLALNDISMGENAAVKTRALSTSDKRLLTALFKDSNLYKLIVHAHFPKHTVASNFSEENTVKIFRRIRASQNLKNGELWSLGFRKEIDFNKWINGSVNSRIKELIRKYSRANHIKGPWQHKVYCDKDKPYLLKKISVNKKSIYFTEKWTRGGLNVGSDRAGGLIPHQTKVLSLRGSLFHLAKRVKCFLDISRIKDSTYLKSIRLPLGFIDELLDNFVEQLSRGIYNPDIKLVDMGIDEFGNFYFLDCGSFKKLERLPHNPNNNPLKDVYRLGINELLINRVVLSQLRNGDEALIHYDSKIKKIFGIDLSVFSLEWKWGDHAGHEIDEIVEKFKKYIFAVRWNKMKTSPVYPLINSQLEKCVFDAIRERLGTK